jgi:predicted acylesterase/phospholipase RssA
MAYPVRTRDEHFTAPGPKRILALDGGGIRGIVTLGYLQRIEDRLRARHGGSPDFRLAHYFDLVAGTSTGAIIAGGLAVGMSVEELTSIYLELGDEVFQRSLWRQGVIRPRYDHEKLSKHLQATVGRDTRIGGPELQTGLLVMTKRMDTGSPWPISNNPNGRYFEAGPEDSWISNGDYPLWKVIRASTAAPSFFSPERITIAEDGGQITQGEFVDGGVSPHNNPTLQAVLFATAGGYRVGWETGGDRLFVVSVGTGRGHPGKAPTWISAKGAMQSLLSLMDDTADLVETMAQWLSSGPTHREIDRDLGNMADDRPHGHDLFTYVRYDLHLTPESVGELKSGVLGEDLKSLTEMDEPKNMKVLRELADLDAERRVLDRHFRADFDLK